MFFWELPIDQLKAFKSITILTYMFDASGGQPKCSY
jgi:hypothetical protein